MNRCLRGFVASHGRGVSFAVTFVLTFAWRLLDAEDVDLETSLLWDFVVAGAGTGGALCAARLAAAGFEVLLLEGGMWDAPWLYNVSESRARNSAPNVWAYPTRLPGKLWMQNDADMRQRITAGKMMGGSSAIHGDVYDRPPDHEFEYAGMGPPWDSASVQAAFSRIESDLMITWIGHEDLNSVSDPQYWVVEKLLSEMALPHLPRAPLGGAKGGLTVGWNFYRSLCEGDDNPSNQGAHGCRRHTSYGDLIRDKNVTGSPGLPGVTVLDRAVVSRVLVQDAMAIGVEVVRHGRKYNIITRRGVALAGGALGTPKILTLSGIGDPLELQRLGVPVIVENREVGQNLADHLSTYTWFLLKGGDALVKIMMDQDDACVRGEKFNIFYNLTGPAAGGDGGADAEVRFFTNCNVSRKTFDFGLEAVLLHPDSRGRVVVPSARPEALPVAEFPPLWDRDFQRMEALLERLAKSLGVTGQDLVSNKGFTLAEYVRSNSYFYQHLCCSARAAPEGQPGVCDEGLRVRGIGGLYVADASGLPFLPSSHTSAGALLAAEIAAATALSDAYKAGSPRVTTTALDSDGSMDARTAFLTPVDLAGGLPTRVPAARLRADDVGEEDTAVHLPMAGLGTGNIKTHRVADAVAAFLRLGGRHIDTATMYDNYKEIRAGIDASGLQNRSELIITVKVMPFGTDLVHSAIAAALASLGMAYIDILLLHWPGDVPNGKLMHGASLPACVDQAAGSSWRNCRHESYGALLSQRSAGRVRAIGVSNFAMRHLDELSEWGYGSPAVHQLELHPMWRDEPLLERSAIDRTQIQAYGCLGGAHTNAPLLRQEGFMKIAVRRSVSVARLLLRWGVEHNASVITGGTSDTHLEENLLIFDWSLTDIEMEFMDSVQKVDMRKMYGPLPDDIL